MTEKNPTTWAALLDVVERLAGIEEPSSERCAEVVSSDRISALVARLEVRMGSRSGLVVIDLAPQADLEGLANALSVLGRPIDISIVPPPIFNPDRPDVGPSWEYKVGHCHLVGGRKAWFGLEKTQGVERLVQVAIHYEETDV